MKSFIAVIMFIFALPVFAQLNATNVNQAGFDQLTESQKAQVVQQVAAMAAQQTGPQAVVDKATQWAQIGQGLGQGMVAMAREMGIAVNEFAGTTVGKIATVMLLWHYMGNDIFRLIAGAVIAIVGFGYLRWLMNHQYPTTIVYSDTEKNIFGNRVVIARERKSIAAEVAFVYFIGAIIIVAAAALTAFA